MRIEFITRQWRCPMDTRNHHRRKEDYKLRTHLIHGNFESKKWDYNHHVVPPVSHSTAFRLSSLERGAKGFVRFASADEALSGHIPIYIYDRLDEPTRGMLEENLAFAEGGEVCVSFASGMAAISAALGSALRKGQEVIAHCRRGARQACRSTPTESSSLSY